jgi:hypothetical protein
LNAVHLRDCVEHDLATRMGDLDDVRVSAIEAAAKHLPRTGYMSDRDTESYICGLQWLALGKKIDCCTPAILATLATAPVPRALLAIATRNIDSRLKSEMSCLSKAAQRTDGPTSKIIALGRRLGLALDALRLLGF